MIVTVKRRLGRLLSNTLGDQVLRTIMSGPVLFIWLCFVGICSLSYLSAGSCTRKEAPVIPGNDIGGTKGDAFTDSLEHQNEKVTAIEMTCGPLLVSIKLKYGNNWGPVRGGETVLKCEFSADETITINLDCDEYITGVDATSDNYINSIQFKTNKRSIKTCGSTTGPNNFSLSGRELLYISGRKGCYVDRLRLHWAFQL